MLAAWPRPERDTIVRRILLVVVAVSAVAFLASCEGEAPAATRPSTSAVATTGPDATGTGSITASIEPTTPTPAAPTELFVAYLYDAELEGAEATATPPYQAAELAFGAASADGAVPTPVRLVAFDLSAGPERVDDAVAEIAGDPAYVAALIAPRIVGQGEIVERLDVPVVSLSSRDVVADPKPGSWIRLVPRVDELGRVAGAWLRSLVPSGVVCISPGDDDGSRFGSAAVEGSPGDVAVEVPVAPSQVSSDTCDAAVWTGDTDGGIALVTALGRPRPVVVGGPALRDPRFVREAGPAANGTLAVCGCADVSTSLSLRAQRFVQVFQSEYGLSPGPGAVEAWDGAHLLIETLRAAAPDGLGPALAEVASFDGLGGRYALGPDGELANASDHVYRYRVDGGRWTAVEADAGERDG